MATGRISIVFWLKRYGFKPVAMLVLRRVAWTRRVLKLRRRHRGYDAGKQIKGRKRFILTDTQGLLLAVWVCAASVSEKMGAKCLLRYIRRSFNLRELCSQIKLVWVDGGYRGDDLKNFVQKLWGWCWQVVLRTDDKKGFKILPRRWVVERTFAWILHARRLSMDYEKNRVNAQSMLYLAMITLMLKRL